MHLACLPSVLLGTSLFQLTLAAHVPADYFPALTAVMSKLTSFYAKSPNATVGLFDQTMSPWWESGTIFETYMDYAKYTRSNKFQQLVGSALVDNSYGRVHDFLGTDHTYNSVVLARWNDDIMWYAQAVAAGGELYGPNSYMQGFKGNGTWISLAQRTIDEVYDFWTDECGGGIYWSRNPSQAATYKSGITQLEFISLATRTYLLTHNATLVHITERLVNWIMDTGMVDLETGVVNDGVDVVACFVETAQWSYSYGHLLGGLSYLYQATGNQSYLDYTANITSKAISLFAPTGVVEELCEADASCNNDQQGFKAIFLRQLAYLYLATEDKSLKSKISTVIRRSAAAALGTCDEAWNCSGRWTNSSTQTYPAFRATHLVAAALVAAEGINARL